MIKNSRHQTIVTLIFMMFLISCVFSPLRAQKQISQEYKRALQFMGTRQFDKAAHALEQIIQKEPTFYQAYIKLVISYKEKKEIRAASELMERMITHDPKNPYAYYGLGLVWKEKKDYTKALQNIQKGLQLSPGQPEMYEDMVDAFQQTGSLDSAHRYLDEILKSNPKNSAAYYGQAYTYRLQNKWEQSLEMLEKAIKLKPDLYQAYFLKGWIFVLRIAEFQKALPVIKAGIQWAERRNDIEYRAKLFRIQGNAHYRLGNYAEAYTSYNEAKKVFEMTGDKKWIETILGDLGLFYFDIGDYSNSEKFCHRAYTIAHEIDEKADQARHLNNLGNISNTIGKYPEALEYFERALSIDRELKNDWGAEIRLGNISDLYTNLGNYLKAEEYSNQALQIATKIGDRRSEALITANLGRIYSLLNNNEKAIEYYESALKKSKEINYRKVEANCIVYIGDYYAKLNKHNKAEEYYREALNLADQIDDKKIKGNAFNSLGNVSFKKKEYEESGEYHRKALTLGESMNDVEIFFDAHVGLAYNDEQNKKYEQAMAHYKSAVDKIEKIRSELKTEQHKLTYLESKLTIYEKLTGLCAVLHNKEPRSGYERKAFQYAEKAKARVLLDIVSQGNVFSTVSEIPETFKQKLFIHEKKIETLHSELSIELSKTEDKQDKKLIISRTNEIESLQRLKEKFLEELKTKYPRYYQLTNPKIVSSQDVQRNILKNDQVLVEYLVAEDNIFLWLITRKEFTFKVIPISRKELESTLARISPIFAREKAKSETAIDHRWANIHTGELHTLYQLLLKTPAEKYLANNTELIIVPDGILHYFPFEMLVTRIHDGTARYLIEDHPISYSSSASLLNPDLKRTRKAGKDLLAFGNPNFSNERKNGLLDWIGALDPLKIILRDDRFEPLLHAELEVQTIAGIFKKSAVFTGNDATEVRCKNLSSDYRYLHFATHYLASNQQPMYSKIILTPTVDQEDGYLQMYEVYNLKLNADMVVLSGCSTGLGKLSKGEGLIGMTRAFLHAGVPSVVVSLWPVEDASTAGLMNHFYTHLKKGLSKSRALQQAKVAMLRSKDVQQDPFYWSPFILIGDSKEIRIQ